MKKSYEEPSLEYIDFNLIIATAEIDVDSTGMGGGVDIDPEMDGD